MPKKARVRLESCIAETAKNTGLTLILALSYSSRWEITESIRHIARDVADGRINVADITEEKVNDYMDTKHFPDPDLLIRTSGEERISNFLLWQIAYTELYFTETLWPDFGEEDLYKAIIDYQNRERRFGKTSEQIIL
jgi:undecaprenyl diphosphate synthase